MRGRRRKKKTGSLRWGRIFALAIALPVCVRLLWSCGTLLGRAGESAAMLSALIAMPEGGVPVLRERFRAEIYNPEGDQATIDREQGRPLPEAEMQPEPTEPADEPEPADNSQTPAPPRVPEEFAAPIINEDFSARGSGSDSLVAFGQGLIKNETVFGPEELAEILETPFDIPFADTADPQVLIVHTHATEAFEQFDSEVYDTRNTWRSTDNRNNMVAVGDAFAHVLEENGIPVIHDTTQHDYPSYNGSYERSAATIRAYLEEYPSIRVVLDLHRDAMQREEAIVKPVAMIDGKKAAQIMIIAACDDGDTEVPEWRQNLRFAAAFQDRMEQSAPGLTRPIYLCYRKYNMDLTTGSLLLEFGSNANTLEESIYSAQLSAKALADLINDHTVTETEAEPEMESEPAE